MRNIADRGHLVDFLFTLALFCVFALSALAVVIIGADVYKSTVAEMGRSYDSRTSVTYIAEKIRQNDRKDAVSVRPFGDGDALVLRQTVNEAVYETYIYADGGKLKELLIPQGLELQPADGQSIMDIQDFQVELTAGSLVTLRVTSADGTLSRMAVAPRC